MRQSHMYSVQVANTTAPNNFFNSFVYEATPRNGNGKLCYPGKTDICNDDDQISIEADIGVDMAWTQFLSDADSIVRVTRSDKGSVDPANVVIRPTPLGFKLQKSGDALLITVPYSANGHRFSVEFTDDLWEYCNANQGLDSHYVQNKNSGGQNYVSSYTNSMPIVGVEPLNALLVFVSPFPSTNTAYTPDPQSTDIYRPKPGLITGLDSVQKSIVYFEPGVYWATGSAQRMLSSSATWVYIAPGAYVKGAVHTIASLWTSALPVSVYCQVNNTFTKPTPIWASRTTRMIPRP